MEFVKEVGLYIYKMPADGVLRNELKRKPILSLSLKNDYKNHYSDQTHQSSCSIKVKHPKKEFLQTEEQFASLGQMVSRISFLQRANVFHFFKKTPQDPINREELLKQNVPTSAPAAQTKQITQQELQQEANRILITHQELQQETNRNLTQGFRAIANQLESISIELRQGCQQSDNRFERLKQTSKNQETEQGFEGILSVV